MIEKHSSYFLKLPKVVGEPSLEITCNLDANYEMITIYFACVCLSVL